MYEIIPGILEKDWSAIENKLKIIQPFAKSAHVDIIDGKFAPNITFLDPKPFSQHSSDLFLELHMMVDNPIEYLESFAKAGFKRFVAQVEKMPNQQEFVNKAKQFGEVGLAIDIPTQIDSLKVNLEDLDCLLVMSVKAGLSGQAFDKIALEKIKNIQKITNIPLEADGAMNDQTIVEAKSAGATRFSVNSFIFNNPDPQKQFDFLKNIIEIGGEKNG